ncbi:MAG TPA: hypothetical protein ENH23_06485 [candidate division Zixibacteria bacterium]|nr:hypothetical protein [candidate division Zixibacteria bacterium]
MSLINNNSTSSLFLVDKARFSEKFSFISSISTFCSVIFSTSLPKVSSCSSEDLTNSLMSLTFSSSSIVFFCRLSMHSSWLCCLMSV